MQVTLFYVHFGAGIFCFFILLILWFYYIVERATPSATRSIRVCSMLAVLIYCVNCWSLSYRMTVLDADEQPSTSKQWTAGYLVFAIWRLAQSLTYIIFIQRLKQTFKHTKYASNSCTYKCLYFTAILFIIPEILKDLVPLYYPHNKQYLFIN